MVDQSTDPPEDVQQVALSSDLQEPLLPSEEGQSCVSEDGGEPLVSSPTSPESKNIVIGCCSKRFEVNHNVFLTLLLDFLYGISDSLWGGTVFAAYLKILAGNRNEPVGNIEAVNGLAVLLSALPVGYLADRYGRSIVIKGGSVLFIFTAMGHAALLRWIGTNPSEGHKERDTILLGLIMALWGIGGGIVSGPCQALFADSTPVGERTQYYFYMMVCYSMASCLGPVLSICLFQTLGDEWSLPHLQTIIYVGLGIELINAVIMMFFDDSKALEEDAQAGGSSSLELPDESPTSIPDTSEEGVGDDREGLLQVQTGASSARKRRWIPYILFSSSLVISIGSGMTVKFFPLFFKDEVGMSPTQVQVVYVLVPIFMSACSGLGTSVSRWFGRVQTSMLLQLTGISFLYAMVFCKGYLDRHPFILVPVYVLRTALVNSPYPLQESILMDFVPKQERARWKSLESVSQFGWCGSAALGGYFADRWDYTFTFLITATVQTIGVLLFGLLLPLVPTREDDLRRSSPAASQS